MTHTSGNRKWVLVCHGTAVCGLLSFLCHDSPVIIGEILALHSSHAPTDPPRCAPPSLPSLPSLPSSPSGLSPCGAANIPQFRTSDWSLAVAALRIPRSTRLHPTGSPAGQTRTDRQPLTGLVGLFCSCKLFLGGPLPAVAGVGVYRCIPTVSRYSQRVCFVFCKL